MTPPFNPLKEAIVVVSGYGCRVAVEGGHLVIQDGVGAARWEARYSRVDRQLKRVVIIGHAGSLSLDAIRWLHGVGVPLVHLDTDGRLFFVAAPSGAIVPALRRNQALAVETGLGARISEQLIRLKVERQRALLPRLPGGRYAVEMLDSVLDRLNQATSLRDLRLCEAVAARAYWQAWQATPVRFSSDDAKRRPAHWRLVGTRVSSLTGSQSPRKAVNPANAILNYLYAILEAEARIAALAVGADPALGFLHTDTRNRDSLACDLMEPVRPLVDDFALDLLASRTFAAATFFEALDGHCRLLPPLSTELAGTAGRWARAVLPIAQQVASSLLEASRPDKLPVRLKTRDGRRAPETPVGGRGQSARPRRGQRQVGREFTGGISGKSGGQTQASHDKRRTAMTRVAAANADWTAQAGAQTSSTGFKAEVQPKLQDIPLKTMMRLTGLSKGACSRIRSGLVVPHPRHWQALTHLASAAK